MTIFATINLVATAVSDVFKFFATPEGQLTVKSWRESNELWNSSISKAATWFEDLFKKSN